MEKNGIQQFVSLKDVIGMNPEVKRLELKLNRITSFVRRLQRDEESYQQSELEKVVKESKALYEMLNEILINREPSQGEKQKIDSAKMIISLVSEIQSESKTDEVRYNFGLLPIIDVDYFKLRTVLKRVIREAILFYRRKACLISITAEETAKGYTFLISAISIDQSAEENEDRYIQFIHVKAGELWLEN